MIRLILLVLVVFIQQLLSAQIGRKIDSLTQIHVQRGFNGNLLYAIKDSIVFTGNYGYSNLETQTPLTNSSQFELASLTKQFTALAILQLVEDQKIALDQTVRSLIPSFPYPSITLTHLLRHQSGLIDEKVLFSNKKFWNRKKMADNQALLQVLAMHQPELYFKPGTEYRYSNTGYAILASVIEQVSSLSYKTYVESQIFHVIGMHDSYVYPGSQPIGQGSRATLDYTPTKKRKRYRPAIKDKNHNYLTWMHAIVGGSGIYSTIIDLNIWRKALRDNTLISEETKQLMFTTDSVSPKYGFGVALYETKKGKWVYHTGSLGGYKTMALYLPNSDEYLVILSNNRYADTYKTFDEALYALISN
ncbi:serine hydrolase domain-containing protein [Sediminicola luteus]|uniref:Beta-lactamase-related domain-containing protein n=1 Tax=Sediminicola luteus TaxID=319238 RepID=A0A2A4G3R6_9FLAO|nr:serine hydrolase domain-containing protein [Sediminicola luteus]PCE62624.1 hypothetical protein B7P33_18500 [Sediminicola luteus]